MITSPGIFRPILSCSDCSPPCPAHYTGDNSILTTIYSLYKIKHMHYLPTTNEGRLAWAQHLRDNLATYSAAFGNNPQQMADMLNYLSVVIACLQSSIKTYNDYQGAIAAQRLMEENELKLLRGRIADFKRDDGYTEAIGGALGPHKQPGRF